MSDIVLECKSLSKTFPLSAKQRKERKVSSTSLIAVDDLDLSIRAGEIFGLLGPNGAGKTTTLRMLSSLISPTSGEVLYRGENINSHISDYRKKVSFLTSELKLDDFFTPEFTFDYFAALYEVEPEEAKRRKTELFHHFGIDSFANSQIKNLSTGMRQKASLAISLCHDPEIIIFDEPTNGLDIIASREVEDFLLSLKKEGKAIIISTHIFSLVEKLCDRVGIITDGKLQLKAPTSELTKEKSLEDVFFSLIEDSGGAK